MNKWENWKLVLISPDAPILEAIRVLDRGALRVALVADSEGRLLGIVTDGNIRRGLLNQLALKEPVSHIMNPNPITAKISDSREHILSLMDSKEIDHVPILNHQGVVVGLEILHQLARPPIRKNWVVLMAGGLGSRLGLLTKECPKPLLKVGPKPILEMILESFIEYGFRRFYFSVNYKKDMIQNYFGDGSAWGVEIRYLEEEGKLGTAGSLSLLPEKPKQPFFVMNGDLLTRINFHHILDFHFKHEAHATVCVRRLEHTIPYGVVEVDQHRLINIEEKPVQVYFANAGIYLLDSKLLPLIPEGGYLDMPDLFLAAIKNGHSISAFPFLDYWMDIGRMGDFQKACQEYPQMFQ